MNDKQNTGATNPRFQEPGMVSVNQRGSVDNGLAKKLIFVVAIVTALIVGCVYAVNQWLAASRAEEKREAELAKKTENQPANVSNKRIFDDYAQPTPVAVTVQPECKEITLLGKNGKPIIGKDGQELKMGCDGTVPAIDFNTPPPAPPVVTIPKNSRYDGDVLMQGTGDETTRVAGRLNLNQSQTASDDIANQRGNLSGLMNATATPKVTAEKLGNRNMILPKGRQIDCALSTKLVSEVSGFASCVLTNNIYSDNGKVLLLERGSDAQGEYVASVENGQRRIFVLWSRVKTPSGVLISLDSPAADGLGTMGLSGHVDNRWWDRLGAAFLLSFVKDAVAYQTAKDSAGGSLIYQNSSNTGSQMADRVLSNTINIKPTIYKNQGDRASIYVARDLDFSTVYALRAN